MPISSQTTVPTAGTAVLLGASQLINGPLMVKALDTNTGVVAVGNDGANDVTVSNGLRLLKGEVVVFDFVGNIASLWLRFSRQRRGCLMARSGGLMYSSPPRPFFPALDRLAGSQPALAL